MEILKVFSKFLRKNLNVSRHELSLFRLSLAHKVLAIGFFWCFEVTVEGNKKVLLQTLVP